MRRIRNRTIGQQWSGYRPWLLTGVLEFALGDLAVRIPVRMVAVPNRRTDFEPFRVQGFQFAAELAACILRCHRNG
jgi:hypothetical protein